MTGKGLGFTFDEQRDVPHILNQAEMHFAPRGQWGQMTPARHIYLAATATCFKSRSLIAAANHRRRRGRCGCGPIAMKRRPSSFAAARASTAADRWRLAR
jgi:hypothetical protein